MWEKKYLLSATLMLQTAGMSHWWLSQNTAINQRFSLTCMLKTPSIDYENVKKRKSKSRMLNTPSIDYEKKKKYKSNGPLAPSLAQMSVQWRAWRTTAVGIRSTGPVTQPPPSLATPWTRAALWPITATPWSPCLERTTPEPLCWMSVRSESLRSKHGRAGPCSSHFFLLCFSSHQPICFLQLSCCFNSMACFGCR